MPKTIDAGANAATAFGVNFGSFVFLYVTEHAKNRTWDLFIRITKFTNAYSSVAILTLNNIYFRVAYHANLSMLKEANMLLLFCQITTFIKVLKGF